MEELGLSDELQGLVRARVEHTANQFWKSLKDCMPEEQTPHDYEFQECLKFECPPNLRPDWWFFELHNQGQHDASLHSRGVLRNCGVNIDDANQILGNRDDWDEISIYHPVNNAPSITVSVCWRRP